MSRPASSRYALVAALGVAAALGGIDAPCHAQRVEFPTPVPGATPYAGSSVYPATPAPTTPVYPPASGAVYPPTGGAVYPPVPQPSAAPAPLFDPYANPSLGTPPVDVPYTAPATPYGASPYGASPYTVAPQQPMYGTPYPSTPAPQTGSSLSQTFGQPQWSNGSAYNYQNPDGSVARLQRLLQQISFEHTYLFGDHDADHLEINRTELAATFGVPIFRNPNTPLLITPGFAFNWLEGPVDDEADLPARVYDAYLDTAWYPRFNDWLGADLGVRTGVWTDFEAVNDDSIRILGRGLGVITLSPRMDVHVGVWYLDRNNVKILPAGGVYWKPNTEWDLFLIFPNPKIRKRFVNIGTSQWWWYAAGEYGGGRWTIERDPDHFGGVPTDDDFDYNDIRVIGGLEWATATQARGRLEAGYVFERELIYDGTNHPHEFELDPTFMFRAGLDF